MYLQVFSVIAPIFICSLVGFIWARRDMPYDADFVSRLVMNIGAPCLLIATLGKVDIPKAQLSILLSVAVIGMLFVTIFSASFIRLVGASQRVYLPSLLFPNCGNMGLPLCLFAFGEEGLALGLIIFIVTVSSHFSLGVSLVSGAHPLRALLRAPVLYAAVISLVLIVSGWELPLWVGNTVSLLGGMSIPLMLISLGVSLANLGVTSIPRALLYSVVRLGGGVLVACLLIEIFSLDGVARGVVLIQFAMPAAIFNYLLAERYQQRPDEVAGLVIVSTLLSFVTLPLLLWFAYL